MATLHSTTPSPTANTNVVELHPADDEIPLDSGVTLVDCDASVIARRLRPAPWDKRTLFFNNIVTDSIENIGKLVTTFAKSPDDANRFMDWAMCEMMRRIGETIDLWGATKPADKDAAVLFFLSLKPSHRRAASMFISSRARAGKQLQASREERWEFVDGYMQETWQPLAVFYRMATAGSPTEYGAWEAGPIESPDDWYDPTKVPADAEQEDVS